MIKTFPRNESGRDFAVGDIHGHFDKLQLLLHVVKFNTATDRLFSVGDLVDRGPLSEESIDWLRFPWFHAVRGNHEDMAIRWPKGKMEARAYVANGGAWNVSQPREASMAYADAFSVLPIGIEVETAAGRIGIVHADCPLPSWDDFKARLIDESIPKQQRKAMKAFAMWSRDRIEYGREGAVVDLAALVVGHTPVERVTSLDNVFYIDTGAGKDWGRLTLVELGPRAGVPVRVLASA